MQRSCWPPDLEADQTVPVRAASGPGREDKNGGMGGWGDGGMGGWAGGGEMREFI